MKKKATKTKHNVWKNVKQIVEMGEEVPRENLEPNMVYSVLMLSKGETALNYEWGIAITREDSSVVRNWNINEKEGWDANPVRIRSTWRVFLADAVSREMAIGYVADLKLHKINKELMAKAETMQEQNEHLLKVNDELIEFRNKHWWRRV